MNSNFEWDDDDDFLSDIDNEMEDDSQVLRKVRKSERAKDKRIKELESQLNELMSFKRGNSLSSILNAKGVNPGIAKFIPSDMDVTEESVTQWLEENSQFFGLQQQASAQQEDPNLAAYRQIDSVVNNALSPDGTSDLFSAINNAQSQEELMNFLLGQGIE